MRKIIVGLALLLLLLALGACNGAEEPTAVQTPERDVPPTDTGAPAEVTRDQPPEGETPEAMTPEPPTPTLRVPTPTTAVAPTPGEPQTLRPRLVHELSLGVPAGNSYTPRALAIHAGLGRLYARTNRLEYWAPALVTAIDLDSGKVLAVAETGPDSYGDGALVVDEARNRLYAVNGGDDTCSVLDAATLEPVTTLQGVELVALDTEGDRLVVAGDARLRVLDAADHGLLAELELAPEDRLLALAIGPAGGDSGEVRVALARREPARVVLGLHELETLALMGYADLPGSVDYVIADPATGAWYATGNDGTDNKLWILDENAYLLEERALGEWTEQTPLAVDPEGGRLFLGRETYPDYRISVMDLDSREFTAHFPVELAPYAVAWDAQRGRVLVSDTYEDQIGVVEAVTGETIATWPTAIQIVDLEVDPERAQLYATDTRGELHVLQSETGESLAMLPAEGLISVDSAHGRLYTGGLGGEKVRIFETDTLQQTGEIHSGAIPVADPFSGGLYLVQRGVYLASLETMTITGVISDTLPPNEGFSYNPTAIDAEVDPGSGRVFAIITNGVPGSNGGTYLYVYEPVTYEKVLTDTERSPWYLDIDPATGEAVVSRAHLAGVSTSLLSEGRTYTARVEGLFGPLRIDPGLGLVYQTVSDDEQTQMWLLDAGTLDVVDSFKIPGSFGLYALDPARHLLYLASRDGAVQIWSALGGELVQPIEPEPSVLDEDGPLLLFPPPGEETVFATTWDYGLHVSDDEGASWSWVGAGLPGAYIRDVAFSPAFSQDGTLLASLTRSDMGFGVWRSEDGGRLWQVASQGLTDLQISELAISPGYAQDSTVFAAARRKGVYRSTDGGQTWEPLSERYRPPDTYDEMAESLVLAPSFGQGCDGCDTLFVDHYGLQRSTDGGDSWTQVDTGAPGYGRGTMAFSPWFAIDRGLVYFWVQSGAQIEVQVYRSSDGGDSWEQAGAGPPVEHYGQGRALVAPDGMLYFVWEVYSGEEPAQVARTNLARLDDAGGLDWEIAAGDPFEAATPLELTADGTAFLALDDAGRLLRWPTKELDWQPAKPEEPTPEPPEEPTPEPPATCPTEPERYRGVWLRAREHLGCPAGTGADVYLAEQAFEQGRMIWHSETLTIYVLDGTTGTWAPYDDSWVEGVDPAWDPNLPGPPQQPQRGFGKVWREQLGGPDAAIGWALENERGVDGWVQPFDHGLLIWTNAVLPGSGGDGTAIILYDDGTWEAISTPVAKAQPPEPPEPPEPTEPVACVVEPVEFRTVWKAVEEWLGCPEQASATQVYLAEQPFEYGRMLWDSETVSIYVMSHAGTWQAFDDTWVEGVDPPWDPNLPDPPQQPQRGFGKVWREQLGGPDAEIGWALEGERGLDGWKQRFENGLLIWTDAALPGQTTPGAVYLLYDNGSWEAKADPGP